MSGLGKFWVTALFLALGMPTYGAELKGNACSAIVENTESLQDLQDYKHRQETLAAIFMSALGRQRPTASIPQTLQMTDVVEKIAEEADSLVSDTAHSFLSLFQLLKESRYQKAKDLGALIREVSAYTRPTRIKVKYPASAKDLVSIDKYIESWLTVINDQIQFPQLIIDIRSQDPDLLRSEAFQKALFVAMTQSTKLMTFMDITLRATNSLGSPFFRINLNDFFARDMLKKYNTQCNYMPLNTKENAPLYFNSYIGLFATLFSEIINNANEAIQRRHPTDLNLIANVDVQKSSNGDIVVTIEDFGYPSELSSWSHLGATTNLDSSGRIGVGIGRFRVMTIPQLLGLKYFISAKPDGSGSVATVILPSPIR